MHYSGIEPCDVLNGTGFRTVIWTSGCSLGCKGCFNQKTHNPNFGKEYTKDTQKYLLECLSKSYIDGITITGGNPLEFCNLNDVLFLIKEIRKLLPNKTIWLYTGYDFESLKRKVNDYKSMACSPSASKWITRWEIISLCDVLVDGEYIDELRDVTLKWRGSSNQRVIDVKETLKQNKIVLYCD